MNKAALERALEAVPEFPAPRPEQEQYRTPPGVAADLLWAAHEDGAIADQHVVDLGCGTGMFALGASLLGAGSVTGVDVDEAALELARGLVDGEFVHADVADWQPERRFDTVLMNPPFGAQRRGADRPFYDAAARAVDRAGTCWFLAQPRTEGFLAKQARALGASLERVLEWDFPIEARFGFHEQAVKAVRVAGYRMAW